MDVTLVLVSTVNNRGTEKAKTVDKAMGLLVGFKVLQWFSNHVSVSHLINFFSFLSFFTFSSLLVVISVYERIQTDDGRNPPTTTDETHHRRLLHLLRQKKDRNPPQSTNELFSVKILREAKRITEEASQVLREAMAFLSKFGNVLKQTTSKQLTANCSLSSPSLFQAIRCMSSSKLFIRGMEYGMNEDSLREAFRKYDDVVENEFKASSKLETITFSEMKHEEIEALVEFMYCVDGSISLESLKKHVCILRAMPKERKQRSVSHERFKGSSLYCESSRALKPSEKQVKEWEEARCPVCMEHPHNGILLVCSSYDNGCRPYMCDTSHRHSNCFDQYRKASKQTPTETEGVVAEVASVSARCFMNAKRRSCSSETCEFSGTYSDLREAREASASRSEAIRSGPREAEKLEEARKAERLGTLQSSFAGGEGRSNNDDEIMSFDDGGWLTVFFLIRVFRPESSGASGSGSSSWSGTSRARSQVRQEQEHVEMGENNNNPSSDEHESGTQRRRVRRRFYIDDDDDDDEEALKKVSIEKQNVRNNGSSDTSSPSSNPAVSMSEIRREKRERETRVREESRRRLRVCARVPVAPSLSIQFRSPSVSVDLLSYPIYFRIWARVLPSEELCLRRFSNGGNLPFFGFVILGCSLVGGSESRLCYSGVCSNGGGDDLAPAIDLSGKDYTRVKDGGGEE
ncbi:LOW QUALITY PROTEIN: hypothetical protein HID58_092590 [Brassica napus]|uniref:Uncharacterized protein n=1 Tax=Brassica napus TaxID=3708 RepID=A0ABQ7XFY1_BRANA|nr:LOW QUALITY PROTEIN: hypothetical protein HID58_092590 [Brassica napus]